MKVPRSQGFQERAQSCAAHPHRALDLVDLLGLVAVAGGDVERLADGEEAHRHHDGVDAVQELGDAQGEARLPGLQVDSDQTQRQAEEQAGKPARERSAQNRGHGGQRQDHEREILGRPEQQGQLDQHRGHEGERQGGDGAGDEGADGGRRQSLGAAALPCHLVAVDRGHDRARLARRVEQDGGGRAAIHGPVIDAAEHDEGGGGVELARDRQEQRHGERRPDPRQDADRGADRDAQGRPEEVHRRQRHEEAVAECS